MSTARASVFYLFILLAVAQTGRGFATSLNPTSAFGVTKGRSLSFADAVASNIGEKDPQAGKFKLIGGVALERPSCVSWGPGRVDCFIRNAKSSVGHWWKQDGEYQTKWADLNAAVLNNVESVSKGTGIIDVLILGTRSELYISTYTVASGKWSAWIKRDGAFREPPSCVARTSRVIDCDILGQDSKVYYIGSTDSRWGRFTEIGIYFSNPPTTSRRSASTTDYWIIGYFCQLWQTSWTAGQRVEHWKPLGSCFRGKAEALSLNPNRIDVVVTSHSNKMMHAASIGGVWQKWADLGGNILESPSCVAVGNVIHCFMTGTDSYLYRRSYDGSKWSKWFTSYGTFIDSPSCVLSNTKEVSCYMRGFDRSIVEMVYNF